MNTTVRNVCIAIIVALLVLGLAFLAERLNKPAGASDYAAVYMVNGDVYFGKLSWNPNPQLDNVWILNRTVAGQNSANPQIGLTPFKNTFWGPVDEINLNSQNILFWSYVKAGTQFANALQS